MHPCWSWGYGKDSIPWEVPRTIPPFFVVQVVACARHCLPGLPCGWPLSGSPFPRLVPCVSVAVAARSRLASWQLAPAPWLVQWLIVPYFSFNCSGVLSVAWMSFYLVLLYSFWVSRTLEYIWQLGLIGSMFLCISCIFKFLERCSVATFSEEDTFMVHFVKPLFQS